MPRYIDADLVNFEDVTDTVCQDQAYEAVAAVPTANVVERRVGKWVDPAADNVYRCSVCEEYTTLEVPGLFYHYCPNCGAIMRRVKE